MAVFYNDKGERSESFVWKPRPACCLKEDGSRDYEKLMAFLRAAQSWDHEAQMRIFEQYSGTWQPLCTKFQDRFQEEFCIDYEDLQQEAFCSYMISLKDFGDSNPVGFEKFYYGHFRHDILDLLKNQEKQVSGKKIRGSLDERYEDGSLVYEIPDTSNEFFAEDYPQIKELLTEQELQVVIMHYVYGFSYKEIAKKLGLSYIWIKKTNASIKEKLKVLVK